MRKETPATPGDCSIRRHLAATVAPWEIHRLAALSVVAGPHLFLAERHAIDSDQRDRSIAEMKAASAAIDLQTQCVVNERFDQIVLAPGWVAIGR
jgi:hypothetical protein